MGQFLEIVLAAAFHTACLVGWGRLVAAAMRLDDRRDAIRDFWLGFAALVFFLQIWHLAAPIDLWANSVFAIVGLAGLFRRGDVTFRESIGAPTMLVAAPMLLWLVLMATAPIRNYDSGLYHFNAVRWVADFAIVPGLGNLHHRLAFNQTSFLYVAFLNGGLPFPAGHILGNLLLFGAVAVECARGALTWVGRPSRSPLSIVLMGVTFPILAVVIDPADSTVARLLSSPSSDPMIFAVGVAAFFRMVALLFPDPERGDESSARSDFAVLVLLCAVGVTLKVSFLVFAAVSVFVGLVALFRRSGHKAPVYASIPFAFSVALGVVWMIRGIVTSGYPLFPLTNGAVPVDWKVSEETARSLESWIESWARTPGLHPSEVLGNWDWFGPWFGRVLEDLGTTRPILFFLVGTLVFLAFQLFRRERHVPWICLLPFVPLLGSAAFWFAKAPDPRFAGATFWCLAAWTATLLVAHVLPVGSPRFPRYVALAAIAFAIGLPMLRSAISLWAGDVPIATIPVRAMREFRTNSGLVLHVPVGEPQAWDSPLPATPYPDPGLALRGDGLQSGFRLDAVSR